MSGSEGTDGALVPRARRARAVHVLSPEPTLQLSRQCQCSPAPRGFLGGAGAAGPSVGTGGGCGCAPCPPQAAPAAPVSPPCG